jgi:hypothetical protein
MNAQCKCCVSLCVFSSAKLLDKSDEILSFILRLYQKLLGEFNSVV